jgi:hypothetical protein
MLYAIDSLIWQKTTIVGPKLSFWVIYDGKLRTMGLLRPVRGQLIGSCRQKNKKEKERKLAV